MKKNIPLILVVSLLCGLLYWALTAQQYTVSKGKLIDLLEQGETVIDLTKVTNFEWTQVDAFGPYTTTEMMEEALGISIGFGGGEVLESNFKIVFANDEKKLSSITLSREYGDYSVKDN
ncbi:hypothetical protein [Solibacillus daqui]|uniref:hypothetical protein n=1 Tax=Solibacillus daqui TaxID=2912187 RepID=UPI002365953B|nr:hypothetical protein [Solibacillus daqui]